MMDSEQIEVVEQFKMTEEQFMILTGALIEIGWALKIIIVLLLVAWAWGLVKR